MTDESRPAASLPVPIGPPRPAVAFGAGVEFGELPAGGATRPAAGGPVRSLTLPAAAPDQPTAGSLPRSDLTDPLGVSGGGSSGAPSPQKDSTPSSAGLRAASHPGWSLPPVAPRAHRRGASSDASSLGADPSSCHAAGTAAAALAAAGAAGAHGVAGTRMSGSDDRPRSSGAGSGHQQHRAPLPPTAASLVRAEESEDRLRRGQSLLLDDAHHAGGIAQVRGRHWSCRSVCCTFLL